jgi:hypothetical protein
MSLNKTLNKAINKNKNSPGVSASCSRSNSPVPKNNIAQAANLVSLIASQVLNDPYLSCKQLLPIQLVPASTLPLPEMNQLTHKRLDVRMTRVLAKQEFVASIKNFNIF